MASEDDEIELEWEEWDGKSPFLHHCIAGSIAGVAEHTLLYPVDTVKTHMQSYCADCPVAQGKSGGGGGGGSTSSSVLRGAAHEGMAGVRPNQRLNSGSGVMSRHANPAAWHANSANWQQRHGRVDNAGMWQTMRDLVSGTEKGAHRGGAKGGRRLLSASLTLEGGGAASAASNRAVAAVTSTSNPAGFLRLWRGVQTMVLGCVPAHALYFSSYEAVKSFFLSSERLNNSQHHLSPLGSSVAGAVAASCHDLIMTPLDTIKQRLQLGHYNGTIDAMRHIMKNEGYAGLYRSFPITLLTNVPYGMVMVSTNEFLRMALNPEGKFDLTSTMTAGCGAGMVAAATTTPLDRIKTRLQTQRLGLASAATTTEALCDGTPLGNACPKTRAREAEMAMRELLMTPRYVGLADAFRSIVKEEGYAGLFRGMTPRLLTHTPAVAISWTTYEGAKRWLASC